MTELQPTEIELTGKKRNPVSVSKRKIFLFALIIFIIAIVVGLTVLLANRASKSPASIQIQTLPPEGTPIEQPNP